MKHRPVLVNEVLEGFRNIKDGLIIDATIGKGGHTFEILGNDLKGLLIPNLNK
jgi:16S rRNA (cytosine1402-N4)-methyltransferase